ncbi:CHAP domain-containing protein [Enterococcus faecalis]|nr:CHAP domain-containing protein [Enterococcus faecalis]EGO9008391.1 CHAP domain-containing protein [Enterococcus faecalis]PQB51816.1 CHAP domain-containing protein [Enterococcus faecalis]PQF68891.1 CHAP domain-containing protein [Enterococcus faecalis]TKO59656.1 CHAP domain-containing protein [Enterococcus faecalis]
MKKSVLSALMVCSITLTSVALPSAAFADEYDTKIQQQDQKINALTSQMSDAEAKVAAIENDMVETAKQIDTLTAKKNKLSSEVSKLYSEISDLNVRIQKREVQMTKQARDVQVNGQSDSIIDAVLDADSVADAIGRVQAVSTMMSANNELLEQQKEDKATVEKKTKNVEKQIAELEAATKELNDKTESLKTLKIQQEVAKNDLEAQRSEEQGKKDSFIKQKKEAEKRLAEEQARQRAAAKKAEEQAAAQAQAAAQKAAAEQAKATKAANEAAASAAEEKAATPVVESSATTESTTTQETTTSSTETESVVTTPVAAAPEKEKEVPVTNPTTPEKGNEAKPGNGGVTSGKQAAINAALADVGNSYATGWNQPGECLVSVRRWLAAGGINFGYGGPNSGYVASGATQVSWSNVQPGDVVQYESAYSPDSWIGGVHTVLVTGVSGGSVQIVEANNPGGSGYVSSNSNWSPAPPAGFRAVVWRFPG